MKSTTIKLSKGFKDWLTSIGNKKDTYEDIIKRLININNTHMYRKYLKCK